MWSALQLVDVKLVIGGAADVGKRMRKQVVAGPVAGVPAVEARREHAAPSRKVLAAARRPARRDVVAAEEREDRSVQYERRRVGRVLLGERMAVEQGLHPAFSARHRERQQCPPRRLREVVASGLEIQPDQQARALPLRERREPGRPDGEGVRHRLAVNPASLVPAARGLLPQQPLAAAQGGGEPLLALAREVALVRAQAPLADRRRQSFVRRLRRDVSP